ncbi:MAG: ROK family protein [Spirochaetales bacterium]
MALRKKAKKLLASVEAGGTKFNCAVGFDPHNILAFETFPTTTPGETLERVISFFFKKQKELGPIDAFGIGCFGPVNLSPFSSTYGYITETPKEQWQNTPLLPTLKQHFPVPIGFDTDVNAAALGEALWGAGKSKGNLLYLTVGTGIGGGALIQGHPIHGLIHPEMGHLRVPHSLEKDPFPGSCPYHADCWEGLASGFAIEKRWGLKGKDLPPVHPAWDLEAEYLGAGIANLVLTLSPELVIVGGGVMKVPGLLEKTRFQVRTLLNGYIPNSLLKEEIDSYLLSPALGDLAGIAGGFVLAEQALKTKH